MLAALAVVLQLVELSLPNPAPWLRLGLANIVILAVLALYGLRWAFVVFGLRITLSGLLTGSFLGPGFVLGLCGGVVSLLAMWLGLQVLGRMFSLVGISLIGAYTHTLTQLVVAYALFVHHRGVFLLLPMFLAAALAGGLLSGVGAAVLTQQLRRRLEG